MLHALLARSHPPTHTARSYRNVHAQAPTQFSVKPSIHFLRFEALLERPKVGRNGRYMSIAGARRHIQDFLAKVLKAGAVVSKRLVDGQ